MTIQESQEARIFNPEWQPESTIVSSLPGLELRQVEADAEGIISSYRENLAAFQTDAQAEYTRRQEEFRAYKARYESQLGASEAIDEQMREAAAALMDTIELKESADDENVRLTRELYETELLKTAKDIEADAIKERSTKLLTEITTSEGKIAADQAWANKSTASNEDSTNEAEDINNKIAYISENKPQQENELNTLYAERVLVGRLLFENVAANGKLETRIQQLSGRCAALAQTSTQCGSRIAELIAEIKEIKISMDELNQKPTKVPTKAEVKRSQIDTEIIPIVTSSPRPLRVQALELDPKYTDRAKVFGGYAVILKQAGEKY